jgi:DNA-binding NtrC family response regulator
LAERLEDLPLLQRHVLQRFSKEYKKPIKAISRRAQSVLARHPWPGNIRELENAIGHAVMMSSSDIIAVEDLPESLREGRSPSTEDGLISLEELQRRHARRVVDSVGGNKLRAAEILGISRGTLYKLLEEPARETATEIRPRS